MCPVVCCKSRNKLLRFTRPNGSLLLLLLPLSTGTASERQDFPQTCYLQKRQGPSNYEGRGCAQRQRTAPAFRQPSVSSSIRGKGSVHQRLQGWPNWASTLSLLALIPGMGITGRQKHTSNFYQGGPALPLQGLTTHWKNDERTGHVKDKWRRAEKFLMTN